MTSMTPAARTRRQWHPLTVACGLLGASLAAALWDVADPTGPVPPLVTWLLLGTAAGFATSGST